MVKWSDGNVTALKMMLLMMMIIIGENPYVYKLYYKYCKKSLFKWLKNNLLS